VGYGDFYPVTKTGKVIGIILEIVGVLSFGLLIGMMTVALDEGKNRFYWQRLFERLDRMEKRLEQTERREEYVVRQVSGAESTQVAEPKAHGMERDGNGKEQEESQN
jgi:hypothetical protein